MTSIIRLPLFCILFFGFSGTQLLYADDGVLPPPQHAGESLEQGSDINNNDIDNPTDLTKELAPPKQADGVEVQTYLRDDDKAQITEYSLHGHVFRIKVQPSGGLPAYYLEDEDGDGSMDKRFPGGYKRLSPPMWVIKRF